MLQKKWLHQPYVTHSSYFAAALNVFSRRCRLKSLSFFPLVLFDSKHTLLRDMSRARLSLARITLLRDMSRARLSLARFTGLTGFSLNWLITVAIILERSDVIDLKKKLIILNIEHEYRFRRYLRRLCEV
jgi:hypothetical protein